MASSQESLVPRWGPQQNPFRLTQPPALEFHSDPSLVNLIITITVGVTKLLTLTMKPSLYPPEGQIKDIKANFMCDICQ